MRTLATIFVLMMSIVAQGCNSSLFKPSVKPGAQVLLENYLPDLKGKRVGLVMNPSSRVNGRHIVDLLLDRNVNVTALFGPEHGIRGDVGAGETIRNGKDQATGLPVYSLYGKTKKPTAAMLKKVDILLFDIQDVGGRFYTYNATLGNILEAGAENNIPVWVLDRPNPAGGNYISGWMMHDKFRSFVGKYPMPMAHGMTMGELAKMIVGEHWIKKASQCSLRVIPMKGWKCSMKWRDTGLEWVPPSPNLPTFKNAYAYLGTVLFEGSTFSEGRGTKEPFLTIGSPHSRINSTHISELRRDFKGVSFQRVIFRPESMPGKSLHPRYEGQRCFGIQIQITDVDQFSPVRLGVRLLETMLKTSKKDSLTSYIQKLSGISKAELLKEIKESTYISKWKSTAEEFSKKRKPYLLYE